MCDQALDRLPAGDARRGVEAVRARLLDRVRIAVAGREKAGKSTLVNALLEQRVAATDVGPCTKVVTWFRYGPGRDRAELVLRGGGRRPLALTEDGQLPASLPVEPLMVDRIDVVLSNDAGVLRDVVLIDTPGLASTDELAAQRTQELLAVHEASSAAVAGADILIFLVSKTARLDDQEAIDAFSPLVRGDDTAPITAVAVLSKADTLTNGDMSGAGELAQVLAESLRQSVATVVPVVALLAETATAGVFAEPEAEALAKLAALPKEVREAVLSGPDVFFAFDLPLPVLDRKRLWSLLQRYGVAKCLSWIEEGATGAAELCRRMLDDSGVDDLRHVVWGSFLPEADTLKAAAASRQLDSIVWQGTPEEAPALGRLADGLEELNSSLLHRLREIWAAQECVKTTLSHQLCEEAQRVTRPGELHQRLGLPSGASFDDVKLTVHSRASDWNAFANQRRGKERRIAEILSTTYALLWSELRNASVASAG
jgi:hypothetical protein